MLLNPYEWKESERRYYDVISEFVVNVFEGPQGLALFRQQMQALKEREAAEKRAAAAVREATAAERASVAAEWAAAAELAAAAEPPPTMGSVMMEMLPPGCVNLGADVGDSRVSGWSVVADDDVLLSSQNTSAMKTGYSEGDPTSLKERDERSLQSLTRVKQKPGTEGVADGSLKMDRDANTMSMSQSGVGCEKSDQDSPLRVHPLSRNRRLSPPTDKLHSPAVLPPVVLPHVKDASVEG